MKAILTLNEMPENCEECPLNYDMFTCLFIPHSSTILMDSERLNDCPLKELPEHITVEDLDKEPVLKMHEEYVYGWNQVLNCIERSEKLIWND